MKHKLVLFEVFHQRLLPKRYQFRHRFFWFKIDLDKLGSWPTKFFSHNSFNLYSFFDSDHIKLNSQISARDNYIQFAHEHGVKSQIKQVTLYTQLRFLGYVFNPVSFIFLKDEEGKEHAIIEIGNTFNELKPFFVHHKHFHHNGSFTFKTQKLFYISPFIDIENEMVFEVKCNVDQLIISIDVRSEKEKILKVSLRGEERSATTQKLLMQTVFIPFVTFKIIFLIHMHALILWLKGIPYFKKNDKKDLQQGTMVWKTSPKNLKKI